MPWSTEIYESYEILSSKKFDVGVVLEWQFTNIIASANRRISQHQKFKDPWFICITKEIHWEIFKEFFHAVKNYKTSYGRTLTEIKDRKGLLKEVIITFTHLGTLKLHLKLVTNDKVDVNKQFRKEWSNGNYGKIVVNEHKPAIFKFNIKKHEVALSLNYVIKNRYGTVISC